ncbi:MAG TPA: glycosyltransferase family 39 protein [Trebonia sp.]|nr:glycosyltransferase family 39 protein [Trebonia sp.]
MTISSSRGRTAGIREAGAPARTRPVPAGRALLARVPSAVRLATALAGLAATGVYLFIALSRIGYPFPVEWLEGNSLVEVHRLLAGQSLYPAPSAVYVPDGYPPLYFAVCAVVARVAGVSYLSLRLVSVASSLACFAVLARLVQRETGSLTAGIGAGGLFAATYLATDTWFDVGRVDSLFLALSLAGLYAARWMRGPRGAIAAGVLLAAAALTKQTGIGEGALVLAVLLAGRPGRRLGALAALSWALALGVSTLVLGLTSGGWYVFYVFKLLGEHSLDTGNATWFLKVLLPAMGLAAGAAVIAARRVPWVLVAGCAALAVEGFAALVHSGGGLNDVLPCYLAIALLAGLALGRGATARTAGDGRRIPAGRIDGGIRMPGPRGASPGRAGREEGGPAASPRERQAAGLIPRPVAARWRRLAAGRWVRWGRWVKGRPGWWEQGARVAAGLLVVTQMALLLSGPHPSPVVPSAADRAAGERFTAGLRALGGTVAVPADPGLTLLAGMPTVAHDDAVYDVVRATSQAAIASFRGSVATAIAGHQFSAIITDGPGPPRGYPATLGRYYRKCPQPLLSAVPAGLFRPVAGVGSRPFAVWLPPGGRSCATVARLLDGAGTGGSQ